MLKELHAHVVGEIQQSSRTDTIFVVSAVLFNLVVLGVNWGVASEAQRKPDPAGMDLILGVLMAATLTINVFAIRGLLAGLRTRTKLISGLIGMYRDNGVDRYYDAGLLQNYQARYRLLVAVVVSLMILALVVPLLARTVG